MLTLLGLIERRPGMYLGKEGEDPDRRLSALELYIAGYAGAVHAHRLRDSGFDQWISFSDHLKTRFEWNLREGPIRAIRGASSSESEAWARFWSLLHEFVHFGFDAG
jgi:hypothetical protein